MRSKVEAQTHYYHGAFTIFEFEGQAQEFYFYRATFAPRFKLLTLNQTNQVYTRVELKELIDKKLTEFVLSKEDYSINLMEPASRYPQRAFVAQFRESNFNFLSRTMEHYGLYYYFDHGDAEDASEILRINDHVRAHPDTVVELSYVAPEALTTTQSEGCVTSLSCKVKAHCASSTLTSYNPDKADLQPQMHQQNELPGAGYGDVMAFDATLLDQDALESINSVRAQELLCQSRVYCGKAYTPGIRSGYFVRVNKHARDDFNCQLLVTRVRHEVSQSFAALGSANPLTAGQTPATRYECWFDAIPADTQFRASRITPKPKIAGLLNAQIDSSETLESDLRNAATYEDGRYKVQPLFVEKAPLTGNGSNLLRMLTPFAGNRSGLQFGLRPGCEVLLAFVDGDPDLPIIVGAAFNSEEQAVLHQGNRPEHVIRSNGGALLAIDDSSGKEKITLYSQGASIMVGKNSKSLVESLTTDLLTAFDV
jgi:type VI secretion system secreted protein VgrG